MPAKLARLGHIGLAKEVTMGTPVVPAFFLPYRSASPETVYNPIRDESVRANSSVLQGLYQGHGESTYGFGGHPHMDTFGHLLAALGLVDTVGATTGGRTAHTLKATAAAPPTYTITDYDAVEARAYPGMGLDELSIKVDVKGAVDYDAKWKGWPSAAASTPVPSFTSEEPLIGWQLAFTAGGASTTRVQSAEWTFSRGVEIIHGSDGNQSPRETFADGLQANLKCSVLFEDLTDYNRFLSYAPHAISGAIAQPVARGDSSLTLTMSSAVCHKASQGRDGKYVTLDLELDGVYNVTDAGPVQAVLRSTRATAF